MSVQMYGTQPTWGFTRPEGALAAARVQPKREFKGDLVFLFESTVTH